LATEFRKVSLPPVASPVAIPRSLHTAGLDQAQELLGVLRSARGILLEATKNQRVEIRRHRNLGALRWRQWRILNVPHKELHYRLVLEHPLPGNQVIRHAPERVEVGTAIDLGVTENRFGCDIARRAGDAMLECQRRFMVGSRTMIPGE